MTQRDSPSDSAMDWEGKGTKSRFTTLADSPDSTVGWEGKAPFTALTRVFSEFDPRLAWEGMIGLLPLSVVRKGVFDSTVEEEGVGFEPTWLRRV